MDIKKSVRFKEAELPPPFSRATQFTQPIATEKVDRTTPVLHQPPLGVVACVITPDTKSKTRRTKKENQPRETAANSNPSDCILNEEVVKDFQTIAEDFADIVREEEIPLNPSPSSPAPPLSPAPEPGDNPSGSPSDSPQLEDPVLEYTGRVKRPLPPGHFVDESSGQVFTRDQYRPEGINPCEVRTFSIQPYVDPEKKPVFAIHPSLYHPVTNFGKVDPAKKEPRSHEQELKLKSPDIENHLQTSYSDPGDTPLVTMAAVATAPNAVARLQERNDIAQLNDRLAHYITEVKHLREAGNRVDSSAFLDSIQILEEGLRNLKNLYEEELDKSRRYADDLAREKNHYSMQANKLQTGLQELENRLSDELEKNRKAQDNVNTLHRSLTDKDRQLDDIRREIKGPLEELEKLRQENIELFRENTELKRKSEAENYQREEAQDKAEQLGKKMDFMDTVHKQETQDLNDRLVAAQNNILGLEQRVRDLTRPDNLLEELVTRVRDSADQEMTMFKEESEEIFNRSVTALKARIDEDARKLEYLTSQNVQLTSEAGEMLSRIRALEGQIGSLEHQKGSLEEILYNERQHARGHITNLESKLQDLQDLLVLKMRELNTARDAQVPLKSEIEALRALLEEEERRLRNLPEVSGLPPVQRIGSGQSGASAPTTNTLPLTAPAFAAGVNIPNPHPVAKLPPAPRGQPTLPSQPLGPVRAKSAPADPAKLNLVPSNLGQGKDYFDQMFNDLRRDVMRARDAFASERSPPPLRSRTGQMERPTNPEPGVTASERPPSSVTHDYNTASSSSIGPLKILEVHPEGKYVRLVNTATTRDEEFGNFLLQQNVGGQPVAVYRFPPRLRFPSGTTITVWSGSNDLLMHQPPRDFVFKEQTKWGSGPECTTILCKPNGQAVAWTTAAHRFTRDAFDQVSLNLTSPGGSPPASRKPEMKGHEQLTELSLDVNGPRPDPVYLRREKESPPSLAAQKHPQGMSPTAGVHPDTAQPRSLTYGNDNSSVNRQTRSQTIRPDPIPGAPYAGATAQRMGSAALRKYSPGNTSGGKGNGNIANRASNVSAGTATSPPPSSFQKPSARFKTGLTQVVSQHNTDFQPPMPRPPLFSTW